ncbi:hypothetical protein [Ornithinibacillus scapharcae]|uniref:hypothetical protein n=1 Tax=Ornithinibacillus scapharcae TaxID=1147159 RepID=UPI000225B83C|nr:hypothetical protein [Ornithinibacillus scapharcae]
MDANMRNKYIIVTIGLIVFLILVYVLYDPSTRKPAKQKHDEQNEPESTKVEEEVNLIDYFNLEAENRKLQAEIEDLKSELFEHSKAFIDPNSNSITQFYEQLEQLAVYKEVTENRIILLVRTENEDGYRLTIATKETGEYNDIDALNQNEIINYSDADGFFSGLVNHNEVMTIIVHVNEKSYEAEIKKISEDISVWYTIYEHKRKSTSEEPDKIRIEALNRGGEVLWEASFEGNLGNF